MKAAFVLIYVANHKSFPSIISEPNRSQKFSPLKVPSFMVAMHTLYSFAMHTLIQY